MTDNLYSKDWFEIFLDSVPEGQTQLEVSFIGRQLPRPTFQRVLDLGCGVGRHSIPLAAEGYDVTGIDRDPTVIEEARTRSDLVSFETGSMEGLGTRSVPFDAVLSLWQSFGYGTSKENDRVLQSAATALRLGGRLIIDVYHRTFFEAHLGTRRSMRAGWAVTETKRMSGGRLRVALEYEGGGGDTFNWEMFTPEELVDRASKVGLVPRVQCSSFSEDQPATPAVPRFQVVFERSR